MSAEAESLRIEPASTIHRKRSLAEAVGRIPDSGIEDGEIRHPIESLFGGVTTTNFSAPYAEEGDASHMGRSILKKGIIRKSTENKTEGRNAVRQQSPLFFDYEPTLTARQRSSTGPIPIDTCCTAKEARVTTIDTTTDELMEAEVRYKSGSDMGTPGSKRLKALYRDALLVRTPSGNLKPLGP